MTKTITKCIFPMWGLFWMATWLNLMQNEPNSYTLFTWYSYQDFYTRITILSLYHYWGNWHKYGSHCYDKQCYNHVTKYTEPRANQDELVRQWQWYQCHVNTPLHWSQAAFNDVQRHPQRPRSSNMRMFHLSDAKSDPYDFLYNLWLFCGMT